MRRAGSIPVFILLVVTLLGGCVNAPPPEPDPVDLRPSLAMFADCPWEYPDNTSIDCDNATPRIEAEESVPLGSLCVRQNEDQRWSLHWDPLANTHGIWYEAWPEHAGAQGTLFLRTAGAEHLFVWDDVPERGFLPIPVELGDNVTFRYTLHSVGYATNGTLGGAAGTPIWSLYGSQFWVVHRFQAEDGTYSFLNVTEQRVRVESANRDGDGFYTFYELAPFVVEGSDFTLWVHHDRVLQRSSQGGVATTGDTVVDRFCQLGLGQASSTRGS